MQSCRGRSTLGPKVCDHCAAICEHDATQLPLVELLVTRRGVRQQHTTTARRCPGPGRLQGREPPARVRPATRASGGGTCGTSGAGISLRDIRRTGPRAACFTRRTPPRKARQRRPPTERGLRRPARRDHGAGAHLRLRAAGVRLRPRREEAGARPARPGSRRTRSQRRVAASHPWRSCTAGT